jgi:hypothetical protein
MSTDSDVVREIEGVIRDHLAAIKSEAHKRILELEHIDTDKAWEQLNTAVDDYGANMLSDATYWLRKEVADYESRRWKMATSRHRTF